MKPFFMDCFSSSPAKVSLVTGRYAEGHLYGPASSLKDRSIIYPCNLHKCRVNCPCRICRMKSVCSIFDHRSSPGKGCSFCQDDLIEHLLFHRAEHLSCKFCNEVSSYLPYRKFVVSKIIGYAPDYDKRTVNSFTMTHCPAFIGASTGRGEQERFPCDKCDKNFPSMSNLKRHEKQMHFGEKHTCQICGQEFSRKYKLNAHMKFVHDDSSDSSQFECKNCNKKFDQKFTFERHCKLIHRCSMCDETFCTLKQLASHRSANHKSFSCQKCGKIFKDGVQLRKHENFQTCEFCDRDFCNLQELTRHQKQHKETLKCSFCAQAFSTRRWLTKHKENRSDKPCPVCAKMFCYPVHLNAHISQKHPRVRCDECEEVVHEDELMKHKINSHNV